MGKLESEIQFTGSIGNLTAYRMRGVDKIIVRRKGGASKERIKNDREFKMTRLNNSEFSGRAQGVHWMMNALRPLRRVVADYNLCAPLNRSMKHFQNQDDINDLGKRSIIFSKHGNLLEGFSMNQTTLLENLVRTPLKCSLSKDTLTATINIPELVPGLNFFPPEKHSLLRVVALLSVVPDLYWTKDGYKPTHPKYYPWTETATTPWLKVKEASPPTILDLKLNVTPPDNNYALMLSIGICFGTAHPGEVEDVKHAGCGKVLAVV